MKLTRNTKRAKGMTLLELTVVILVLLSLISILFVGARAWKKGSDRSSNIMNLRNTQQAMRGHQNMNNLSEGGTFGVTELEDYMSLPTSPIPAGTDAITYTAGTEVTAPSSLWLSAAYAGDTYYEPTTAQIEGW